MIDLYHHGSSACAAKVRFALEEKALGWSSHVGDIMAGEQFSPAFLAMNPKGLVPVLLHDGFIVRESTVICEYLDDYYREQRLYPDSARDRAVVRSWIKAVDDELQPACSALTYVVSHRHTVLRHGIGGFEDFLKAEPREGACARRLKWDYIHMGLEAPDAVDKIRLYDFYLEKMERALETSIWLAGEHFTMADVAVAPYVNRVHALNLHGMWRAGRLPNVEDWFTRVRQRPAFARAFNYWMPPSLAAEMALHGSQSWSELAGLLKINAN